MRKFDFISIIAAILSIIAMIVTLAMASRSQAIAPVMGENGKLIIATVAERKEPYCKLTDEEYALVCAVVDLEAGGEGEELQRAVTEVILNRIESGLWGKTVAEVVWSPNQFEVMAWLWKANPSELTRYIVKDVFDNGASIPKRVLFFRKDYPHGWNGAVTEFNVGNIWFSSSRWLGIGG